MNRFFTSACVLGAALGAALTAAAGHDLPINGTFLGTPSPRHVAPGWNTGPGGFARLLRAHRRGRHVLELTAAPNAPKLAYSEIRQAYPGMLQVGADVFGRGTASLGFEAFDAARRLVTSGRQSWQIRDYPAKLKYVFDATDPAISFVRIILTAEAGSVARFYDVEAEISAAPAPAPVPPPPAAQYLVNDQFYPLHALQPVTVFQAAIPAGSDIEFKLGEDPGRNRYWSIVPSYDVRVCRVELKHRHKGHPRASIGLKAYIRGTTNVEFVNTDGRRVIVQFTGL